MSELDRDSFLESLEKLLSETDAEVLTAAREIKSQMAEAEVTWDMLLVQAPGDDDDDDYEVPAYGDDDDEDEEVATGDPVAEGLARTSKSTDDDLTMIEALLARDDISDETREDLNDYKGDIAEGEFTEADHRYLLSLHQRLTGKKR